MYKKLFQYAILSTPILAIYGIAPLYIFEKVDFTFFIILIVGLSVLVFSFWVINIFILKKIKNHKASNRYILSYALAFLCSLTPILIHNLSGQRPELELSVFYQLLTTLAINTIILMISNSILLQYEKENADLEIQALKINNLEAQKQMLMQQLQPHFLFNSLNTLKSLISESQTDAEDYTLRLSAFLRYSVHAQANELVRLEDELKFTKDYMDLQKARFDEALNYQIDISDAFLSQKIPVFALQTLVENAIKHNAATEKKPLLIEILIDNNRVKVQNNKLPKKQHDPSGTGLQNLAQRYKLIADTDIEIVETENRFIVFLNLL
jgi:two-component system, LytTR family, sensor kinase